ncbi:hypothetical protein HJC23_004222 [Cyclotella cryptica]|uniref:DHHA2 domain-containing protein n=1 Tax=Cyclotella cryptica TaxID=29204 RepID=A0ABD3QE30_9STRA|eukprot:CCRYP_007885-RA/>CCRYP_007885-RA protein AED:0.00 eAED:0.00 QI:186/-1/1/1/-1/1/1/82/513
MAPILSAVATVLTVAKSRGALGLSSCIANKWACFLCQRTGLLTKKSITRSTRFTSIGSRSMSLSNTKSSFVDFLENAPTRLTKRLKESKSRDDENAKPIQLIMGNEAGDADSIISALTLAYVQNILSSTDQSTNLTVPIVSIPRADLPLRRDAVLLLDMAGINADKLLHADDEIVSNLLGDSDESSESDESFRITLVDHNRLRTSFDHLSRKVSEIVDHHEDEHFHDHITTDSGKREIAFDNGVALVASTCTLVAERLFRAIPPTTLIDRSLGLVLLSVILLDSVNMLPAAGKGTYRDEAAVQTLLKQTDWSSSGSASPAFVNDETMEKIFPRGRDALPDRTALFDMLSSSKFDPKFWNEMSVRDCLRIDYKKFPVESQSLVQSIGLSSVLMDMNTFIEKQQFHNILADFVNSESVDILGVLALYFNEGGMPIRELLLTGRDPRIVHSFAEYLTKDPDAAFLQINERTDGCWDNNEKPAVGARLFTQGNAKGSRKQVAPVLLRHASKITSLRL